jgi:hypothetical protein
MAVLLRIVRALSLALLLPALLAPSGWAWQVCFCEAVIATFDGAADEGCCDGDATPEAASCCDVAGATSEGRCGECGDCRMFDAGNRAMQPSTAAPELPDATFPIAHLTSPWPAASGALARAPLDALPARGLAPPRAPAIPLALRI